MQQYSTIDLIAFEPRSAGCIPDCSVSEQGRMLGILLYSFLQRRDALNVLFLNVLRHLPDIIHVLCDHGHGTARGQRPVRSIHSEIIGHVWCSNSKIRNWSLVVYVLQVDAVSNDREAWHP